MATKFKFEIESDGLTSAQTLAFRTFIGTLGGAEFLEGIRQEEVKEEKPKATRKKAEKVEAPQEAIPTESEAPQEDIPTESEAPQEDIPTESEAPQQEKKAEATEVVEPETVSAPTLMQIRSLVAQKAADHKDAIKAKLGELGSQNVSTLDAKHFQTIFEFLTEL